MASSTGVESEGTATGSGLRWLEGDAVTEPVPHLVIGWSLDEPHRIGETAAVTAPCVVGRGASSRGPVARAAFLRVRPGDAEPRPALSTARLSREQLRCTPHGANLLVENIGRLALRHNGRPVSRVEAAPGDTLALEKAFVFLVERRPRLLEGAKTASNVGGRFEFGGPDAFGLIGESPAAWALRNQLAIAARGVGHVLLQGDSGAGKELAVRAIHGLSDRRARTLVARNAATFPESLIDAELFGNREGFPNEGSPLRPGLVGEADGSALFLDEIGELPEKQQAHLLRVLDGGEYQRLGESKSRRSDFRLYAATNRELSRLKHDVAARFETRVCVPGFDERRSDVPLVLRGLVLRSVGAGDTTFDPFLERREDVGGNPRVDPGLVEALLAHKFTHHARELAHLIRLSASTSSGNFLKLTPEVREALGPGREPYGEELTPERIQEALAASGGSKTEAAKRLGLKNRYALLRLLKKEG